MLREKLSDKRFSSCAWKLAHKVPLPGLAARLVGPFLALLRAPQAVAATASRAENVRASATTTDSAILCAREAMQCLTDDLVRALATRDAVNEADAHVARTICYREIRIPFTQNYGARSRPS